MGRAGDCGICYQPKRTAIETARAGGTSYADLARQFGLPETSLRRHFKLGHALPAVKPAKPPAPRHPKAEDPDPQVSLRKVRQAAAILGVPFGELASCLANHVEMTIVTASAEEEDELLDGYEAAEDCAEYMAAVVRVKKFYAETAGR
jgi:transposase-like protein